MYVAEIPTKTKSGKLSHKCILLRESYREKGKVKTRTIANLTNCKPEEREAITLALKYKDNLAALTSLEEIKIKEGKSVGSFYLLSEICKELGISKALGSSFESKLAIWQLISRIVYKCSRLSSVRLAKTNALCDILEIRESFNEDKLYDNLKWLCDNQNKIEDKLFKIRNKFQISNLFLYDVTSSYLEGKANELSAWGYNRDKKQGKKQIVMGLLCDDQGYPVSVELFKGNTNDTKTFSSQIEKVAQRFKCDKVTFVGDKGMIKNTQLLELKENFHFITTITKAQINKLIDDDIIDMSLFDKELCEVKNQDIRYILRKNPYRTEELKRNRNSKKQKILELLEDRNKYLLEHKRAKVEVALRIVQEKIEKLKLSDFIEVVANKRTLKLIIDSSKEEELSGLDGCYVIKTDLSSEVSKEIIHKRYKDLSKVEYAFRTIKTGLLEVRPWYVRKEAQTRGHALIAMLSYIITKYLEEKWQKLDLTVEEGLRSLSTLCTLMITNKKKGSCQKIPEPRNLNKKLFEAVEVKLPSVLPDLKTKVSSRKKLF